MRMIDIYFLILQSCITLSADFIRVVVKIIPFLLLPSPRPKCASRIVTNIQITQILCTDDVVLNKRRKISAEGSSVSDSHALFYGSGSEGHQLSLLLRTTTFAHIHSTIHHYLDLIVTIISQKCVTKIRNKRKIVA